jgi:hypothetical protein
MYEHLVKQFCFSGHPPVRENLSGRSALLVIKRPHLSAVKFLKSDLLKAEKRDYEAVFSSCQAAVSSINPNFVRVTSSKTLQPPD